VVEVEIKPGPAIRNDPCAVEDLAAGVGFALVMIEKDAGRAMQLTDNNPLGAIYDKGTVIRHQRNFAEIDFLLLDVPDCLSAGFLVDVPGHQAHPDLDRRGKSHAALMAFGDVVLGSTKGIGYVFQGAGVAEVANGKHRPEYRFEPDILPRGRRKTSLKETFIGIFLYIDQVWYLDDTFNRSEVFP